MTGGQAATDHAPHHHNRLRPFFRDHPAKPVPEENFWTLRCKGRLTQADTQTIRLSATPCGLTSAHLHHPSIDRQRIEKEIAICLRMRNISNILLTVRLCIRKTLNVCAWGDKVPPCSVSNILDIWLRTVTRVSLACTAIQAESNELFGVIIKRVFVKIFRKFQRHCFRRFSREFQRQRLLDGPRHLLVINLMRAAIRRGGCDGGHSWGV